MKNFLQHKLKSITGYTLIEIMIVIGIIGILSTISIISFSAIRSKERDSRRLADMKKISFGLEKYRSINGRYPQCDMGCSQDKNSSWFSCLGEALEPIIGTIPVDPDSTRFGYCISIEYGLNGNMLSIVYGLENDTPGISNSDQANFFKDQSYGVRIYTMLIQPYGKAFNPN